MVGIRKGPSVSRKGPEVALVASYTRKRPNVAEPASIAQRGKCTAVQSSKTSFAVLSRQRFHMHNCSDYPTCCAPKRRSEPARPIQTRSVTCNMARSLSPPRPTTAPPCLGYMHASPLLNRARSAFANKSDDSNRFDQVPISPNPVSPRLYGGDGRFKCSQFIYGKVTGRDFER